VGEDSTVSGAKSRLALPAVIVGLLAFGVSLLRLWLGNHEALTQVLWAEDGLFPLCIEKAGFLTCLVDPFAGYLLLLPRLLAGIVQFFPESQWALVTNVLAALIAAAVASTAYMIVRRFGAGWMVSGFVALLPVLAPIVGLEAIGALGSVYMPLIFIATLVIALPSPELSARPLYSIAYAALLLLAALTIPLAGILIGLILVQAIRRAVSVPAALIWSAAIVLGLVAQIATAVSAEAPRVIRMSFDSFGAWADGTVAAILTYIPGLTVTTFSPFERATVNPSSALSYLVVAGLVALGVTSIARGGNRRVAIGLLVLSGIAYGAIPSLIGWANNRYFVIPVLLWGSALLLSLDPWIRARRAWVSVLCAVVIGILWWPLMGASEFRSKPTPRWTDEVARVAAACSADPARNERPIFSPFWPPNWGDGLIEPTHPDVTCFVGRKWR
jgi:hypothetical protein